MSASVTWARRVEPHEARRRILPGSQPVFRLHIVRECPLLVKQPELMALADSPLRKANHCAVCSAAAREEVGANAGFPIFLATRMTATNELIPFS